MQTIAKVKSTLMAALAIIPLTESLAQLDYIQDTYYSGERKTYEGPRVHYSPSDSDAMNGTLEIATYNIKCFPKGLGGISMSNIKEIGRKLNSKNYDVVLLQEMFDPDRHETLRKKLDNAVYPYRTPHWRGYWGDGYGDGLITMASAVLPFDTSYDVTKHKKWDACAGTVTEYLLGEVSSPDCMTQKGFTMNVVDLNKRHQIHVYNLHQDAGRDRDSLDAKWTNFSQLADYIATHSAHALVIVGGDFNLSWHKVVPGGEQNATHLEHQDIMEMFLAATGGELACESVYGDFEGCRLNNLAKPDHIVLIDNSSALDAHFGTVEPIYDFTDDNGEDLSDHLPVKATLHWNEL